MLGPEGCLVGDPEYLKCICTNTKFLCPIYYCETSTCSPAELARMSFSHVSLTIGLEADICRTVGRTGYLQYPVRAVW